MNALLLLLNLFDQLLEVGLLGDINVSDTGCMISHVSSVHRAEVGHTE